LIRVAEWLFLGMLVIMPADIYLTLPGQSSGIFLSELLAAEACVLLAGILLLGRITHIAEGTLLHWKDVWPLVLVLAVSLLAVAGAHSKSTGLRECAKYAFFLGVYALARVLAQADLLRDKIHLHALTAVILGFAVVLACGVYMSVPGVPDIPGVMLNIQRVNAYLPGTGDLRNASTFRFPDELNAYLLLILPLLAACALKFPARVERFFFGFLVISGAWLLVQTYTRTGLVICLLAGPALFYLLGKRRLAIATVALGILGVALVVVHGGQTASRILSLLSLSNSGYTSRLQVWHWAWHAFAQHPLLGVGPRNLQFVPGAPLSDVYRQRIETNAENTYLNVLADMGILGAAAVTTAVVGAVYRLRVALRSQTTWLGQAWHAGVGVGLLALLLDGTVHPTLYSSQVVGILCALIGLMPVPYLVKPAVSLPPSSSTEDRSSVLASRIIFLINCHVFGPIEQNTLNLAAELQQRGVSVLIVTPRNGRVRAHAVDKGVPVSHLDLGLTAGPWHGNLGILALLINPLSRQRISWRLHMLVPGESVVFVCPYLREQLLVTPEIGHPDIHVVWLLHSAPHSWLQRMLFRRLWVTRAAEADAVATMFPRIAEESSKLGLPAERLKVFSNSENNSLQLEDSTVDRIPDLFVAISPLTESKGIQYLIGAMPRVLQRRPKARLAIAGLGPYEPALRRQVHELGLEDQVEFLGDIVEPWRLLRQVSLLVYPSVDPDEVLPAVIREALATGTPVIGSAIGRIPDLVVDRRTGLLCWPGDSASLANAIITLLDEPARARAMGHAGREMAQYSSISQHSASLFLQLLGTVETVQAAPERSAAY
jgi:glycosyltransferase involved in cell wall biosynthesis/O-antigen ligase